MMFFGTIQSHQGRNEIPTPSSPKYLTDIKRILSENEQRERLFRDTVFGPWLDIRYSDNESHLMHFVLQHQVKVSKISSDSPPLKFKIGQNSLEFGRKEFCLITRFRLGKLCIKKDDDCTNTFRERVFPGKIKAGIDSVYARDCLQLVNNENRMLAVSDHDVVRLCLLILAMLVFMGTEDRNCSIPKHILDLVEDFVLGMYFPGDPIPNLELYPTNAELCQPWYRASIPFITGLADEQPPVSEDHHEQLENEFHHEQADIQDHHEQPDIKDDQQHFISKMISNILIGKMISNILIPNMLSNKLILQMIGNNMISHWITDCHHTLGI
ncbi:phospholipase-like protein [Artemisia annua]|uniref:Phospholipase-like protein n=1 Tax=Artemisia annua TaxID=35608 RepID=A0A2U1NPJ0_ARTAN|nr:phospholipase-like protein [Artemisia annua]